MSILLVALLVLLYSFQSAFANQYARHYPGESKYSSQIYSVFYGVIVSLATFVLAGFSFKPSLPTVLFGVINGAVLVTYNAMLIRASSIGSYAITMIFNLSGGILIPMFWSMIHDGATLTVWQYIAIGVMLVSFVFLNLEDKKSETKVSAKFLIAVLLLGLANGIYGALLNTQKSVMNGEESAEMIMMTFFSSAVFAFLLLLIQAGKAALPGFRQTKKSTLFVILASVSAASAVNILMYALGLINVAVLYSLDNGGVLIVSVLWSAVILKEKLNRNKIIGLILAIAAVFALSIL